MSAIRRPPGRSERIARGPRRLRSERVRADTLAHFGAAGHADPLKYADTLAHVAPLATPTR